MAVGKVIAQARKERRMTQAQLAEATGMSLEWVKQVETGRTLAPREDSLRKTAAALDIPVSDLLNAVEAAQEATRTQPTEEQGQALYASFMGLQRLSPRRLREVQKLIEAFIEMDERDFQSVRSGTSTDDPE